MKIGRPGHQPDPRGDGALPKLEDGDRAGDEANRIYLSGVWDQYLGRRYHVGDELGHVLGYTAAISAGNENNRGQVRHIFWCWTRDASHQDHDEYVEKRTAIATASSCRSTSTTSAT